MAEWQEALAPDGRTYYFNTETKETSWEDPRQSMERRMSDPALTALPPPPVALDKEDELSVSAPILPNPTLAVTPGQGDDDTTSSDGASDFLDAILSEEKAINTELRGLLDRLEAQVGPQ